MTPATGPCVGNRPHPSHSRGRLLWRGCGDTGHSRLVCRVLAPPEAPGRRPRDATVEVSQPPSPPVPSSDFWSSTTSFASQLLSHFRVPAFAVASPDAVLREASTKERELQVAKAPLDVSAFLSAVGVWELKHIRKLSSLTALTYFMHLVTPRRLMRMHGLELVTSSRACDIRPYEHNKTAEEVGADGDGMAVSVTEAREVYQALKRDGGAAAAAAGASGQGVELPDSSNIVALTRELPYQLVPPPSQQAAAPSGRTAAGGGGASWPVPPSLTGASASAAAGGPLPPPSQQQSQQQPGAGNGAGGPQLPSLVTAPTALPRMLRTPAEVVAAKIAEAAVAASAAASATAAAAALASAAESLYAGLASLPIGGALVGANNRTVNALLPAVPPLSSAASVSSFDDSAGMATTSAPSSQRAAAAGAAGGVDVDSAASGSGGRKATAASIAAMATEQIRQQTLRGIGFGLSRGGGGGGMAAVSASGLTAPATPAGAATAAVSAASGALAAAPEGASTTSVSPASSSSSSLTFSSSSSFACPSEWFVVDDPATHTRVFVIQGSDTLDHWKLNLTFDPVTFEDPALGVKVHRGVYEAALALYERFLPLVYEHLESSPFSKIAFTGHSIGGSLATLLMLIYRCRGVLPPHSIATVYTFGAPAVFCQTHSPGNPGQAGGRSQSPSGPSVPCPPSGSTSWVSPSLWSLGSISATTSSVSSLSSFEDPAPAPGSLSVPPATRSVGPASAGPPSSSHAPGSAGCGCGADLLLARLHLPPQIIRNVIMARDIVPRAFTCDYSPVADILKTWGSSFKEHCCLNRHGRKHLYYFVGRMCILQPDSWHTFTANDPDHPMLPSGPGFFHLTDPHHTAQPMQAAAAPAAAADSAAATAPPSPPRPAARSVAEAICELMDCPHPLETLADPGAYLTSGSISRYHNPEHYTKALGRVMHLKRQVERRTDRRAAAAAPALAAVAAADPQPAAASAPNTSAAGSRVPAAGVPWDSSDGLDMDLRLVAPACLAAAADAHACH